jgi:signal transduction histidine kinase
MLFMALASSILITMGVVWGVLAVTSDGPQRWKRDMARMEVFAGSRFAQVWDRPAERTELAQAVARGFEVRVELTDPHGALLETAGPVTSRESPLALPVVRAGGERLGTVTLRGPRGWSHPPLGGPVLALATVIAVLWLLAGLAARGLARPLRELTRVAREIGAGKLESRARLHHGSRGEVGELARAVNNMAERIEAQLGAQKALLGDVSHELRTPLARVRLLVDIARDEAEAHGAPPDAPKKRDVLTEIEAEVVEMDALVGDLLAGARMDFGALSLRDLDVRELAERAVARASAPGSERRIAVEVAAEVGSVHADATLVARALGAMLDNACKHGRGAVVLRVSAAGDDVVFAVEDEGPGFAPGEEERAFAAFYRGNGAAHDEARGVGLGLALVRRIAEAHGGRAFAENRADGGGARVSLAISARAAA